MKWSEIAAKSRVDPEMVAQYRRELERRMNRPWWRLVALIDRHRARVPRR